MESNQDWRLQKIKEVIQRCEDVQNDSRVSDRIKLSVKVKSYEDIKDLMEGV